MEGLRFPELLIIGLIVLILFGPGKLAGVGKGLGEGIRGFKKAMAGDGEEAPPALAEDPAAPGSHPRARGR